MTRRSPRVTPTASRRQATSKATYLRQTSKKSSTPCLVSWTMKPLLPAETHSDLHLFLMVIVTNLNYIWRLNSRASFLVRNKLYSGESSGRRGRLGSIVKNRKNSSSSNMSTEIFQDIFSSSGSNQTQQQLLQQAIKTYNKENANPAVTNQSNLNESIFLDTPPYFSSPESKSRHQYSNYNGNVKTALNQNNLLATHTSMLNNSYSTLSANSVINHSSPRVYPSYEFLNSPKLSPSPTPYRKKVCYYNLLFV